MHGDLTVATSYGGIWMVEMRVNMNNFMSNNERATNGNRLIGNEQW